MRSMAFSAIVLAASVAHAQTAGERTPGYETVYARSVDPPPDQDAAAASKELDARLAELERLERRLAEQVGRLERGADRLERAERVDLGVGAGVATGPEGATMPYVDANLGYLSGHYFPFAGGGIGFSPSIGIWRLSIRPVGLGLLFYHRRDEPFTAVSVPRSWDIVFDPALDVRIWRELDARVQVTWFFPNPFDVAKHARKKIAQDYEAYRRGVRREGREARDDPDADTPEELRDGLDDETASFRKAMDRDADIFGNAYKRAGRSPFVSFGARWTF